jgi:hypothetical protein
MPLRSHPLDRNEGMLTVGLEKAFGGDNLLKGHPFVIGFECGGVNCESMKLRMQLLKAAQNEYV